MPQETIVYLVNLIIGVILATLLTQHWRLSGRSPNMGYWMVAAWVMTTADALFAARPEMPYWLGRLLPPVLVTVGHSVLLLGAQKTADREPRVRLAVGIVGVHALLLAAFLLTDLSSKWRMVVNGVVWGGLSLSCFLALRHSPGAFHRSILTPAAVFATHAGFHALRISLAALCALQGWTGVAAALQTIGDLEVSFFMVALFVSLLISHLQLRNEELRRALTEVQTLSGLLPICAWCRKVRDDAGYWQQLEDYFVSHSHVKFTHGICGECTKEHFAPKAKRVK